MGCSNGARMCHECMLPLVGGKTVPGLSGELVMEPGPMELSVGASSSDIRSSATLTVTGKTRTVSVEGRAFLSTATVGQ